MHAANVKRKAIFCASIWSVVVFVVLWRKSDVRVMLGFGWIDPYFANLQLCFCHSTLFSYSYLLYPTPLRIIRHLDGHYKPKSCSLLVHRGERTNKLWRGIGLYTIKFKYS